MRTLLRYLWALPWTAVGLAAALLAMSFGARPRMSAGVLEVHGGGIGRGVRHLPAPMGFDAITLGHVVLAVDPQALQSTRTHERAHVRQYERWGPLFVPAYLAAGAWQCLRGRHAYHDNPFETQACAEACLASAAPTPK